MRERQSSPNCTHMDMDRVYGYDQRCCVCGSFASIGFLYQCKQDNKVNPIGSLASQKPGKIGPVKSSLRNELEKSGLSESIIRDAENGHYTSQQLQKLKQMKRELQNTIIDVEQAEQASGAIARLMQMSTISCSTGEDVDSLPNAETGISVCTFKACHACRPHSLDRVYVSFQTAVTAEFSPMTKADIAKLPIRSAAIMRNMNAKGRRVPSKKSSNASAPPTTSPPPTKTDPLERTFKITQADIEQSILQRRPHGIFPKTSRSTITTNTISSDPYHRQTSLRRTQGFKTAVQGIFRYNRDPHPPPLTTQEALVAASHTPLTPTLDMTAVRLARREKMRSQLLKQETSLHKFSKPVKKPSNIGSFNVVRANTNVKTQSRFQIYSIDADTDADSSTDVDGDLDTDTDEKVATTVARIQAPSVVAIGKGEQGGRMRKKDGGVRREGLAGLVAQV